MTHWCRFLSSGENPSNSLLWAYPGLNDLVATAHVVHLHACMFGSQRKKATALASNRSWFRKTAVQCSRDHPHASWGKTRSSLQSVWTTSLESANTSQLSHAWASCAAAALSPELRQAPKSKKRGRKEICKPDFDNILTAHAEEAAPFEICSLRAGRPKCFVSGLRIAPPFSSIRRVFLPRWQFLLHQIFGAVAPCR